MNSFLRAASQLEKVWLFHGPLLFLPQSSKSKPVIFIFPVDPDNISQRGNQSILSPSTVQDTTVFSVKIELRHRAPILNNTPKHSPYIPEDSVNNKKTQSCLATHVLFSSYDSKLHSHYLEMYSDRHQIFFVNQSQRRAFTVQDGNKADSYAVYQQPVKADSYAVSKNSAQER